MEQINLAIFGGSPAFKTPRSTSNLIQPDKKLFLSYIKQSYDKGTYYEDDELISQLEGELSELHGAKHCVAVCNGLWGLVMTIYSLKLEGKTEIVMPSLTYRRMADIAAWLKMTPHYCDVSKKTLGITAETAEKCINNNTALILAPHPIVNLCDIEGLIALSKKHEIPLLFDSVEAGYSELKGRKIGSFGEAECFSVHASKFINGFEGGYITTNSSELANKLKAVRNNGIDNQKVNELGIGGRLNHMHAAMTLACIDGIEKQVKQNKSRFLKYKELLSEIKGIDLIEYDLIEKRGFKNILVKLNKHWPIPREDTLKILQAENMVVRPYYYPPLHLKKSQYKTITGDVSNTTNLMEKYMLLPCGEFVSEADIETIVSYLRYIQSNSESTRIRTQINSDYQI